MFIERASLKNSFAPAERNDGPTCAPMPHKHCAPLERGLSPPRGFYKHRAPLEPSTACLAVLGALCFPRPNVLLSLKYLFDQTKDAGEVLLSC
jgi:hypothetical protein